MVSEFLALVGTLVWTWPFFKQLTVKRKKVALINAFIKETLIHVYNMSIIIIPLFH